MTRPERSTAGSVRLHAAGLLLLASLSIACAGCARTVEYSIGEPITMGPFTFSVTSAAPGKSWESVEGTFREIHVQISIIRDESAPYTHTFHEFFVGQFEIVDAAGNSIGGDALPVTPAYSGGRWRSDRYDCRFRYSRSNDGVRDFAAIGTEPKDFQLLIHHPAPSGTQPGVAVVRLR